MPVSTRLQIKNSVLDTTQQLNAQIGDLVNDFINITVQEIGDPAWCFDKERHHLWGWLKRKTTFATVSGTTDYVMERDVDKIALLRQTTSPCKLSYIPDEIFYREHPNPTESGNPTIYRLWEIDGVSTRLAAADTIDLVSSSGSDGSSVTATVLGYISGRLTSETYTMNGTSTVAGTKTFDAREIFVSKSAVTVGDITVKEHSGSTNLVIVGKEETSPRFKVLSLYPTPNSAITMYLEYYKRIREMVNDSDVPEFDPKWHHVVRIGTLAKVYQHLGKTTDFVTTYELYRKMVRSMVSSDTTTPDLITTLKRHEPDSGSGIRLHISEDTIV